MEEKIAFHGQTTFIDRPKDTIIQNFQNTYLAGDNSDKDKVIAQMAQLIELVLDSKELPDSDKEEVTQALHSVAEQVKEEKAAKLTLKGTLEAVKDIVSDASDIAIPALAIIATLFKLLGLS